MRSRPSKTATTGRILGIMVLVAFAAFDVALGIGASSLVDDCVSIACSQAAQALLAFLAAGTLGVGCYRLIRRQPLAKMVFLGTSPLLLLHVVVTLLDPNESIFFVLTSAIVPVATLITLVGSQLMKE